MPNATAIRRTSRIERWIAGDQSDRKEGAKIHHERDREVDAPLARRNRKHLADADQRQEGRRSEVGGDDAKL